MEKSKSDFNILIDNIEVIKANYTRFLSPFFYRNMIVLYKQYIYSIKASRTKKDLIWEYLNDDIEKEVFNEIANKLKK